ncbi:ABC transporter related [Gluconacetobacter diazotrophicus PA1 5]|uniref:Amino acid ABC transporter ATP-binding protein n=1 Tax=Gluconacetobacter diazotrophicus TaxID=33996 RepID=A0A7W4I819_GLUDI|nr:ATP-binding cassette domain-containing protein [Gluconacetobacter diazotrophicus]ACI50708.1 ABC transporter related [Gluconacetobacter diazotrophicus PA1 5]MBB2157955.1 amino acid ABC transporter ATP-binding protein [Gluconacetobacter diazotrophicus]TWA98096.1 amino acid ABC transporter ATP-binding protein (PAAT family) [Gluconacetobacter diazotrophicus]
MPYLDLRGVTVRHGTHAILRDVGLQVGRGEIVSLIGPSGSGKSTLLRALIGLQPVVSGLLTLDGAAIDMTAPSAPRALRARAAIVFQQFGLFDHMSVLRNLTLAPTVVAGRPRAEAEETARNQLRMLGLADKADVLPSRLSGGQKQRVAIARALMTRPHLLLLDEPTSALDPRLVSEVTALLRDLARAGMTIVQVSHGMDSVAALSDRIVLLEDGRVRAVGAGEQPAAEPSIAAFMNAHR